MATSKQDTAQMILDPEARSDEAREAGKDEDAEEIREIKRPVPDGGWGWWVVMGSTISQVILGGMEKSRGVIYPELIERFGSSSTTTAWVISLTGLFRLCGGPVASVLSNKFGIRPVVMTGGLIITSCYISSAFALSIVALVFTYGILGGIGQMCAYAPTVIIVGLYFNKRRALAAGLSSAGIGIGTFIVPPLVELMLEELGFTGTFFILAGLGLNLCVTGALYRPLSLHWKIVDSERRRKLRVSSAGSENVENGSVALLGTELSEMPVREGSSQKNDLKSFPNSDDGTENDGTLKDNAPLPEKEKPLVKAKKKNKFFEFSLLKDFPFLSFCVTLLLLTMAAQIGQVFIATMARDRGVSKTNSALLLSIIGACDTIGRVGSGFVFDMPRIKPHRQYAYNIFLFLVAGCCCIYPAVYSFPSFAVISAAFGFFAGIYISQKSVIIVDLVGADKLVYSFGLIIWFQGIGFLVGPTLSGVLIDHFKRYDFSFYFAGAVCFLAGLVFMSGNIYSYRRKKRQNIAQD